jgi:hypothetical protein
MDDSAQPASANRSGSISSDQNLDPRALAFIQGLLSETSRKNAWQVAEEKGEAAPYAIQQVLDRAKWDCDGVISNPLKECTYPFHAHVAGLFSHSLNGFDSRTKKRLLSSFAERF